MRACGPASGTILSCLLCNIYRWKGYYILWDEELPFDISDQVGVSEGSVTETMNKALQVCFFDPGQYEKNKILTSDEIQRRFLNSTQKRVESFIDANYLIKGVINGVNSTETKVSGIRSTQSIVKESKGEESSSAPAADFFKKKEEKKNTGTRPPEFSEVLEAFTEGMKTKWLPAKINQEAQKFFSHYDAMGWKVNGHKIEKWQSKANEWVVKEIQNT